MLIPRQLPDVVALAAAVNVKILAAVTVTVKKPSTPAPEVASNQT